ncbi:MAG: hypothetical protein KatS3mg015_2499 [Fimbriimonadales bacterium]|nr:MAG: hypothetical protein KatS3mg015_2499 [Fimbriimonadales bacterium]
MDIRAYVSSVYADERRLPVLVRHERYEDGEQFVGEVFGARSAAPSPVALALLRAAQEADRKGTSR